MANFKNILLLCFLCLAVELVVSWQAAKKTEAATASSPYVSLAAPKQGATKFEPLEMKFPDTTRTAQEAAKYVEEVMDKLPTRAKKEDKNLKMTGQSCARGLGEVYKVVDDNGKLLYEICYDDDRSSAIYTTHSIDLADKDLERSSHLSFKALYTLYGTKVNDKYTAAEQTKAFDANFGKSTTITEAEIKKMNYFSRNHLTPHADFQLAAQQELTYFFQNCVPGKQSMNQGSWSSLEDLMRAMSIQMKKSLQIYTGTYGILMKTNNEGKYVEVYLDQDTNRIEVPLVIWKLVIDSKTKDSVAFFTTNDTDMDEKQVAMFETMCNSVCDKLGYSFKDAAKSGITLCCTYEDFKKHIKFLPVELKKTNLLKNTVRLDKLNASKKSA